MKRPRFSAAFLAMSLVGSVAVACNVFVNIGQCESDTECPRGSRCDQLGRFCSSPSDAGEPPEPPDVADAGQDVVDAVTPSVCDIGAPFTMIAPVRGLEEIDVLSARLTPDQNTLIFSGYNGCLEEACIDLMVAKRSTIDGAFTVSGELLGVNAKGASEYWPTLTADGRLLFFESSRSLDGGVPDRSRIWTAVRTNSVDQFSEPRIQDIFKVGGIEHETSPYLHPNGGSVYFSSLTRPGNKGRADIFVAQLDSLGGASSVANVDAVNTPNDELFPIISLDERALYFGRDIEFSRQIMVARRAGPGAPFAEATPVSELNVGYDWPSWLSDDSCRLYFVSNRKLPRDAAGFGSYRLWVAERAPAR